MAYNRNQARALCNDSEYALFTASLADSIDQLTAAQLRSKIKRARTLRDKNADLFRRQSLALRDTTGTKRGKTGAANERTEQKARLFDETLKRFEKRLEKITSQSESASSKAPTKKSVAQSGAAPESKAKKAAAKPAVPKKAAVRKASARTPRADAARSRSTKKSTA
ncbi:hypothetical protein [Thioalkalivibrio sp.]|uniref:hypothetical protein n=1 Tax=Thioalkalivibrio sp. TaxID=2093813 RepID=UPI0012D4F5B7|nr:hypothetical protein [Thioalkalivibrio sp.]TVP79539.1 MAG: hypothetical protein EA346_09425 [Thioalkalivibrio sp.]